MQKQLLIIIFSILFVGVFGQKPINKIYRKIINADSVILVSHEITNFPVIIHEKTHEKIVYQLVSNNKPNYKIIKEQYLLNKEECDSVSTILVTLNTDRLITDYNCFIPHHGLLIFKKGKCSYLDICFGCRHFITSSDIKLSDELSDKTWAALEAFFRNRGLNYELPPYEIEDENSN